MQLKGSDLKINVLRSLISKLTDRYRHAIQNDRPLKDAREIKKAIHYVEKKLEEAELADMIPARGIVVGENPEKAIIYCNRQPD